MAQLTIEDIARLSGVSRSTVSRVLNEHPGVKPAVRQRVQEVIGEYGYSPQAAARQLVTRRTRTIGLILPDNAYHLFGNPIFAMMGQGVSQTCTQRGYSPMFFMGRQDMSGQSLVSLLRGRQFEGIIVVSSQQGDSCLALLREIGLPYVRIGHESAYPDQAFVDVDNVAAARMAVRHLIALGHRRIALLKGLARDRCSHDRYEGYKEALAEADLPLVPELVGEGDWSVKSGYELTQQMLRLDAPPTALFSSNDMMVAGVMRAVSEAGLTIPADLAIVGFDDLPQTTMLYPALTTVRQPCVELGARAAELLIDQLEEGCSQPMRIFLPTTLVIRQSCGYQAHPSQAEASQEKKDCMTEKGRRDLEHFHNI